MTKTTLSPLNNVIITIDDERITQRGASGHARHISGTAWSTKRYLNIELLKDQEMRDTRRRSANRKRERR